MNDIIDSKNTKNRDQQSVLGEALRRYPKIVLSRKDSNEKLIGSKMKLQSTPDIMWFPSSCKRWNTIDKLNKTWKSRGTLH